MFYALWHLVPASLMFLFSGLVSVLVSISVRLTDQQLCMLPVILLHAHNICMMVCIYYVYILCEYVCVCLCVCLSVCVLEKEQTQ